MPFSPRNYFRFVTDNHAMKRDEKRLPPAGWPPEFRSVENGDRITAIPGKASINIQRRRP
jgi:hypothetical protein